MLPHDHGQYKFYIVDEYLIDDSLIGESVVASELKVTAYKHGFSSEIDCTIRSNSVYKVAHMLVY